MGHLLSTKSSLVPLIDRLNRYPIGLVDNAKLRERPSFLCNCCRCCCELMAGVQSGFADGLAKTPFIAQVDPQRCDYCGECLKACNVKCIGLASGARGRAGRGPDIEAGRLVKV